MGVGRGDGSGTQPAGRLPALDAVNQEPVEPTYRRLARIVNRVMPLLGYREWSGQERVPADGGLLVVSNHTSHFDPLVIGQFLIWSGRWPRFLGKVQIFRTPGLGWLARSCGQIPVERHTRRASDALLAAESALHEGKCVAIYPEGTLTQDPDGWPMRAKSGAARLALETEVPVLPVAQWGSQFFMPARKRGFPFVVGKRHRFQVLCGDPVPLDDLRGLPFTTEVMVETSNRIMDALTGLVEQLRGDKAGPGRWDPRAGQRLPVPRGLTGEGPASLSA